ncbi:MAG: putative DNA binding domain-containing protein [Planctomycetaceae bacterium]|nr:putative DNA binding domain-containing protein [Planctomycetaceae bacterium]
MSDRLLKKLVEAGESETTEFKPAEVDPESVSATACAFLNSHGGTLVIGIGEKGQVVGVPDALERAESLRTFLRKVISPKVLISVNIDSLAKGADVVTVEVPVGQDRPYVSAGTIFVRHGSETRAATADVIRSMVQQQALEAVRWERGMASGVEISDLDSDEVELTVTEAQQTRGYTFRDTKDVAEVLADLSLLQQGRLTNAATVLFGTAPSRRWPQTRIRVTAFSSDKGGDYLDDRVLEGHAFALLEQAFSFVRQHVRISAEFQPGQVERSSRPEYPFEALREGIVNAIVHRDYSLASGGMAVGIYPGRIEIWNSGHLPKELSVSDLKRSHPSLPANPDMAHVFYLRGVIERIGRGTVKIVEQCKAAGLKPAEWKAAPSGITLTFFGGQQEFRLNRRQRELLQSLPEGATIEPAEYYARMDGIVSQRQAQRDLSTLASGGWLRQEGEGPATVYVRTAQPIE